MASRFGVRGTRGAVRREVLVGALGTVFAVLLGAFAFGPWGDPGAAEAEAHAAWERSVENQVLHAWNALLEEGALIAPVGDRFVWMRGEATAPARPAAILAEAAAARGSRTFATRLATAEVLEVYDTDLGAALQQVLNALDDDGLSAAQRALGRLRAIQLAARAGRIGVVRDQWALASSELSGAETDGSLSLLLACGLAAGRALPEQERCAIATRLSAAWGAGELAVGEERVLVAPPAEIGPPIISETPRLGALARRVEGLASAPDCLDGGFARRRARWIAVGLRELIGPLPEPLGPERWKIHATDAGPFAVRGDADGRREGVFLDPRGLGRELVLRLERGDTRVDEVRWAFAVTTGSLDGPGTFLDGWLKVMLQLPEGRLPADVRAAGRFARLLRWSLLLAAASLCAASLAIARSMARERRLAELKSTFVANVSHELRTPLASILLMAENLEEGRVSGPEALGRYHANIRREAQRLRRLVSDVLDFSRLERGAGLQLQREDLALDDWCEGVANEARDRAERDSVPIEIDCSGLDGVHACFDGEALRRVVINLVDNAIKYGTGSAAGAAGAAGAGGVRLSARIADDELEIVVADDGPGIPAADREAIFDPFLRLADGDGPAGTGLGLAIVRAIVEAHGGRVSAGNREAGAGARFEVRVPLDPMTTKEPS